MKVRVHETSELPWVRIGDLGADPAMITAEQARSHIRYHELGSASDLQMSEVDYVADTVVWPHSHDVPEIIYVVEGELQLGTRALGAGSSVFIDSDAVYSFKAGPQGLKMLIFRPHGGAATHSKRGNWRRKA